MNESCFSCCHLSLKDTDLLIEAVFVTLTTVEGRAFLEEWRATATRAKIFQTPGCCSLKNLKHQVHAVTHLHNFVINERLARLGESADEAPKTMSFLQDEDGNPILIDGLSHVFPGWSELRETMARNVETMGLTRPSGELN
jgi:hypothetical protein